MAVYHQTPTFQQLQCLRAPTWGLYVFFFLSMMCQPRYQYRTYFSSDEDGNMLQNSLKTIQTWCYENHLILNLSKCKVMSFHKKYNALIFNYSLNKIAWERCIKFKDPS